MRIVRAKEEVANQSTTQEGKNLKKLVKKSTMSRSDTKTSQTMLIAARDSPRNSGTKKSPTTKLQIPIYIVLCIAIYI